MIQMPVKLFLESLSEWKAFKGSEDDATTGHRIILIHRINDSFCYFIVTSKVDKAKERSKYDINSLVEIDVHEWEGVLTKPSCIECRKVNLKKITAIELANIYVAGNLCVLGNVPEGVKNKIKNAINASKTFNNKEKSLYTKD